MGYMVNKLKEKAKEILDKNNIEILSGEKKIISILQDFISKEYNDDEIELQLKILNNIENYLYTKEKMIIQKKDYEYLKHIAEILRKQKVRIGEHEPFKLPVFKVPRKDGEKNIEFMTKEGIEEYMGTKDVVSKEERVNNEERRTVDLFDVEYNTNLEIEKIIEIIERNY